MRTRIKVGVSFALIMAGMAAVSWNLAPARVAAVDPGDKGDSGDKQVITTYDGPMVRKRAAIAIHPDDGADRGAIRDELLAAAKKAKLGTLTEATFAVFSEEMLNYLVPEMTFVLPEGTPVAAAEAFMRDYRPDDVAFYLTQTVLVHDLTFAVIPASGIEARTVRDTLKNEGILTDSLNRYDTTVQPAGLTVRYFGAVVSDATIATVRTAMGQAAGVPVERVLVEGSLPGAGVDLSDGVPELGGGKSGGHH